MFYKRDIETLGNITCSASFGSISDNARGNEVAVVRVVLPKLENFDGVGAGATDKNGCSSFAIGGDFKEFFHTDLGGACFQILFTGINTILELYLPQVGRENKD